MDDKISVIIPVYKVEPYLRRCLDSVVDQTYKNLEILLIDDESPDHCGEICDEYGRKDARVRVKHKQNAGVHAAWNDGLTMASGDWIAFVDSDDWIEPDYFESMMNEGREHNADLIQSSGYYREEDEHQYIWRSFLRPFVFCDGAGKDFMIVHSLLRPRDKKTKAAVGNVWGKLYRSSFVQDNGFRFDPQIRTGLAGDIIFNTEVYLKAGTIVGISYYGYHYRITGGSGTFRFDPGRPAKEIYVDQQLEKLIIRPNSPDDIKKAFESYCLRDMVHNLERCFFHPDNTASSQDIAMGIREMKQTPYGKTAIESRSNPYNGLGLKAFQTALRFPWVRPLRVIVGVWDYLDNRTK